MEKIPTPEKLPKSLELAQELENSDDPELLRSKVGELLDSIVDDLHISFMDAGTIYREMEQENCLARVEKLSKILETVELDHELAISDETETHYANAVIPKPQGIQIAFAEGQAPGAVRTMVGFGKTIIGFKTENVKVEEVDFQESDIRDAKERRYLCRHVTGKLHKGDIRYVVMRIPKQLVDEEHLTEEEKGVDLKFIFRAFETPSK